MYETTRPDWFIIAKQKLLQFEIRPVVSFYNVNHKEEVFQNSAHKGLKKGKPIFFWSDFLE